MIYTIRSFKSHLGQMHLIHKKTSQNSRLSNHVLFESNTFKALEKTFEFSDIQINCFKV